MPSFHQLNIVPCFILSLLSVASKNVILVVDILTVKKKKLSTKCLKGKWYNGNRQIANWQNANWQKCYLTKCCRHIGGWWNDPALK